MSSPTSLRNIAIFGAGGHKIGHHVLHALVAEPAKLTVSVIARASSTTTFPSSVNVIRIPDSPSHTDLVSAFQNQDAIISAVGYPAKLQEPALIEAAIAAGVKRFVPSEYGLNNDLPAARALNPIFKSKGDVIDLLRSKESSGLTWTSIPTGMWLDWSLSPDTAFLRINPTEHTAGFFNDGEHKLSFSTLPWAAKAIVKILEEPEKTANRVFPVRAFEASQADIVRELEKQQDVKYEVSNVDGKDFVREQKEILEAGNGAAAYALIRAGFMTKGYGSNFVEEAAVPVGSEELERLNKLSLEEVVSEVLGKIEKGERTY
jgi:uncharacterized protein YbjT (DUF2867 family)